MTARGGQIDDVLVSPVRRRIVAELSVPAPQVGTPEPFPDRLSYSAADLAVLLDLHVSTVRFHLDQLVAAHVLQSGSQWHGVGRPRKVYAVVDSFERVLTTNNTRPLMLLSELLVVGYDAEPHDPQALGEQWARDNVIPDSPDPARTPGEWLAKVGAVTDVMLSWGFEGGMSTGRAPGDAQLTLHDCPFRELAQVNPALVCGIHRGVLAGTLRQLGEADSEVTLHPFAAGESCIAHLRTHHDLHPPYPSPEERST